jgi:hypothetical protein
MDIMTQKMLKQSELTKMKWFKLVLYNRPLIKAAFNLKTKPNSLQVELTAGKF